MTLCVVCFVLQGCPGLCTCSSALQNSCRKAGKSQCVQFLEACCFAGLSGLKPSPVLVKKVKALCMYSEQHVAIRAISPLPNGN